MLHINSSLCVDQEVLLFAAPKFQCLIALYHFLYLYCTHHLIVSRLCSPQTYTTFQTGWADIGLTQQGKDQAIAAGKAIELAVDQHILPSKEIDVLDSNDGIQRTIRVPAIDVAFCSLLRRATDTMNLILNEVHLAEPMPPSIQSTTPSTTLRLSDDTTTQSKRNTNTTQYTYNIPIVQSWRLNERHYGALVGLSKSGAERLYGKVRLTRWRDSWDVPPPPMPVEMVKKWGREDHCQPVTIVKKGSGGRTCVFDPASATASSGGGDDGEKKEVQRSGVKIVEHGRGKTKKEDQLDNTATEGNDDSSATSSSSSSFMPPSESLRDTFERFLPLWIQGIAPHLRSGRTVLVVGHANTIRSMLFAIDGEVINKENAKSIKVPSALPLVYEFVDKDGDGCLDVIADRSDEQPDTPTERYQLNGRECSQIVPGNLRVLKPRRHPSPPEDNGTEQPYNIEEVIYSDQTNKSKTEMRYHLNGVWVETEETKSVSFCTDFGKQAGEQDIA